MRFIRKCLVAASYVLVFLGSAQAQSVTIGSNAVWSAADSDNGNLLSAQIAKLSQAATVQSLSFYVTAASGNLILGIYDATGPGGRARRAQSLNRQLRHNERLEYGQGGHACLIARRLLLADLSAEQQCSWVPKNELHRQLQVLQLQVWRLAEQIQHLAGEL